MRQLHDTLDKLFTEVDHLDRITDTDELSPDAVLLALTVAKKVKRRASDLVRELARERDHCDE